MNSYVVTGASTGIGEACALRLDRGGHRVFAGVRREQDADALRAASSDRLVPLHLDVTDAEQLDAATRRVAEVVGAAGLQGLVNNAGIAVGGPLEYLDPERWRRQLEVNVVAQVAVTQAFLPRLRDGRGRIVFVGSAAGRVGQPLMGPYAASKHAVEGLAESLRAELHPWDIPVTVVEPGAVRTAIWDKGRALADELEAELPAEALRRYGPAIAKVRAGIDEADAGGVEPDRVAVAVERALTSGRPRFRVPVGTDAQIAAGLARLLPDRAKAAVLRRFSDV